MNVRTLAWTIWGLTIALAIVAVALLVASRDAPVPDSWGFRGFTTTFALGFGTIGVLIVLARRNVVGWILLAAGLISGLQDFAEEYAIYGVLARPGSLPRPDLFAWFESWIWVSVVALVAIYLPLWFPEGHFRSPRWRVVGVIALLVAFALAAGLAVNEGPLNNAPFVLNPFGITGFHLLELSSGPENAVPLAENSALFFVLYAAFFACAIAAVSSLVARFRGASGIERLQIKWFALGAAFAAAGMIVGGTLQQYKAAQVLFILAIQLIPFSVAIAVLRYRLYDVDVVIRRTLVYGVASTLLVVTYVAAVIALRAVLDPLTSGSDVAVAGSTLLVVALFQPVRGRVQRVVDRRFYRSRYDAARTLDRFIDRLRDEIDVEAVRHDVLSVVRETLHPAHASMWLRDRGSRNDFGTGPA